MSLCFHFSAGSREQYRTSRQIIILDFLEHQGKLEQEKLRKRVKRDSTQKLNSIENQSDVLSEGRKLDGVSSPTSAGSWACAAAAGALTSQCFPARLLEVYSH